MFSEEENEVEQLRLLCKSASQIGNTSPTVLEKPEEEEGGGESRRSSTRHPGIVSIKYSDMLLVDPLLAVISAAAVGFNTAAVEGKF